MSTPFYTSRLVEFADTDMAGIIHFSAYFRYMESAEHELLRSLGFSVYSEVDGVPVSFPRVAATCEFDSPARCEDTLDIDVTVRHVGNKSVTYGFDFSDDGRDVAHGTMTSVCCRVEHGKPPVSMPIPEGARQRAKAARRRLSRLSGRACSPFCLRTVAVSHLAPLDDSADNGRMAEPSAASRLPASPTPIWSSNTSSKNFPRRASRSACSTDVSLTLRRGENLAILGPSGSGKSTLLSILGTLEPPTSGSVRLAGEDPFALDEAALAHFRSRQIGFVFQEHHLLPQCTVLENVLVPFLADGVATHIDEQHAQQLLDRVGLAERLDHRPAELSGGERQRVAIARALVREPTLLLADEPTGNLDRTTAQAITELLLEMQAEANTILIVVTHSAALAAALGRRMELDAGRLVPRE